MSEPIKVVSKRRLQGLGPEASTMKTFPLVMFAMGLAFFALGFGFGEGGSFDLVQILLGLLQTLIAAVVLGWIPMPVGSSSGDDGEDPETMNKH
jgi:hypothetical protein